MGLACSACPARAVSVGRGRCSAEKPHHAGYQTATIRNIPPSQKSRRHRAANVRPSWLPLSDGSATRAPLAKTCPVGTCVGDENNNNNFSGPPSGPRHRLSERLVGKPHRADRPALLLVSNSRPDVKQRLAAYLDPSLSFTQSADHLQDGAGVRHPRDLLADVKGPGKHLDAFRAAKSSGPAQGMDQG